MPQEMYGQDAYNRSSTEQVGQGPAMNGAVGGSKSESLSEEKSEMPLTGGSGVPVQGPVMESPVK